MSANAELDAFNHAVSEWAKQFAPELQRVARIIGNRMGWDHHEFTIAWSSLQRHYEAAYGETISLPTLKRYARLWADQGGLKILPRFHEANGPQLKKANPGRLGKDGKRVGTRGGKRFATDGSNTFVVDFDVVVKGSKIHTGARGRPATEYWTEPWAFGQAGVNLPLSSPSVAGQLPRTTFNSVHTQVLTTSNPRGNKPLNDDEVKVAPSGTTPGPRPPAQPDGQNVIYFWKDGRKRNRVYSQDRYSRLPARRQARDRAKRVELTPDEAAYMWTTWPKGFPDAQLSFLAMFPEGRARIISGADQTQAARDEREAKTQAASQANAGRVLITAYREQLIAAGVAADEIDQRIAGEWADLKPHQVTAGLKCWMREVSAA